MANNVPECEENILPNFWLIHSLLAACKQSSHMFINQFLLNFTAEYLVFWISLNLLFLSSVKLFFVKVS